MASFLPHVTRVARPSFGRLARVSPRFAPTVVSLPRAAGDAPIRGVSTQKTRKANADTEDQRRPFHKTAENLNIDPVKLGPRGVLPEFNMKDKVVIVSGGAQGLGLVQVEALLEAGATVHVLDRQPLPGSDSKYQKVAHRAKEELDSNVFYHQIDVKDGAGHLNDLVEKIANQHGRLDGLIAAAGIQQETPALEYTAADSDKMLAVNVTGVLMTAQAVARQMIRLEIHGSIAFIASMSGTIANRGLICPVYNASKAGVIQLARNLAAEWGEYGIRVNTISPGYIVTDMVKKLFEKFPEREIDWPKQNMLNKLSKPEDYRGAAVFLISDASRFMTGADLRIDGGHAAW